MPQHQHEKEVPKFKSKALDIPDIVELYIASVMRDSTNMSLLESELDKYVKSLTPEERLTQRETVRCQLTTGSKVCESILNRYLSS